MKKFLADTFAMITSSWVIGMLIETQISGLTWRQSVKVRLIATLVNLVTGGLYGKFRDWLFRFTKTSETNRVRKTLMGTVAFVLFQMPIYTGNLLWVGANLRQIVTSVGTITIIFTFIGGPYEWYLTWIRRLFRVKSFA